MTSETLKWTHEWINMTTGNTVEGDGTGIIFTSEEETRDGVSKTVKRDMQFHFSEKSGSVIFMFQDEYPSGCILGPSTLGVGGFILVTANAADSDVMTALVAGMMDGKMHGWIGLCGSGIGARDKQAMNDAVACLTWCLDALKPSHRAPFYDKINEFGRQTPAWLDCQEWA